CRRPDRSPAAWNATGRASAA
ncbi:MAG: hypothetical protein AVDCRST_MAG89-2765, partial [uncultured Gemmatimonadetes bacterium]